tara:strand:+ start:562 stop:726 length:165 start_codon:yes stop_codon:yes gene_type:complete
MALNEWPDEAGAPMYALGGLPATSFAVDDEDFVRRAPLVATAEKNRPAEKYEEE